METISSRSNPRVQQVRALRQRKVRDAEGLFLVEGTFHVGAAAEARAAIEYVIYAEELLDSPFAKELNSKLEQSQIPCFPTSPEVFESLSDKENPQGLLAVVRQNAVPLSALAVGPASVFVAIVAPQDPGNVGSILRTVDAAGADGLLLLDGGVDPYHPSAVRAGMGAHFTRSIVRATFADFASWAKQHSVHVYGSSARAEKDYHSTEYERPAVLLLGSEREGLGEGQLAVCEQVVSLPMKGRVTSLNLSVAAGILLYEMLAKSG